MIDTTQATNLLGITLPISETGLKQAFKRAALKCHPDHGGSPEDFIKLQAALTAIQNSPMLLRYSSELSFTTCGKALLSLGNGYPLTEASMTCDACKGAGYTIVDIKGSICSYCNGQGIYSQLERPCPRCSYTDNSRGWGCRFCDGLGMYLWLRLPKGKTKKCHICGGRGATQVEQAAHLCYACKGIGEVKMWNPVLHRGLLG